MCHQAAVEPPKERGLADWCDPVNQPPNEGQLAYLQKIKCEKNPIVYLLKTSHHYTKSSQVSTTVFQTKLNILNIVMCV